jgi:hypothetical protein
VCDHPWRESLPASVLERFDKICDQFEDAWLKAGSEGPWPRIEDFLPDASETKYTPLAYELILLDVNYRRKHGENPQTDEYQAHFPSLDLGPVTEFFAERGTAKLQPERARSGVETTNGDPLRVSPQTKTTRIRCPHCHNPIQLLDERSDEVLCPGCGSSFRLREARQTTTVDTVRPLGKFQLLERVGLGAFGAVWKARDGKCSTVCPPSSLISSKGSR